MRVKRFEFKSNNLGTVLKTFLEESEKAGGTRWPDVAKNLAAASFVAGAEWAASHPHPEQVLRDAKLAQHLFNQIPE